MRGLRIDHGLLCVIGLSVAQVQERGAVCCTGLRTADVYRGPSRPGPAPPGTAGFNVSAVASLDEGLEETLPLNAHLGQLTDKVDHSRTSDQQQRWVVSALILIEARLRRIKGYRHLPQLRAALQAKIGKTEHVEKTRVA